MSRRKMVRQAHHKKAMQFRQSLFWDVDPKTIDPKKNASYVIERILEFGTDDEVRWLWFKYPARRIFNTVMHRRGIRASIKPLWKALTSISQ